MSTKTETPPKGKGIEYDLNNPDHKFYFAIYTNMARHNAYIILNSIYHIVYGKADVVPEDNITGHPIIQTIYKAEDIRKVEHARALLERWLPFSTSAIETDNEAIAQRLKTFLTRLNDFRNHFSHYYNKPLSKNKASLGQYRESKVLHFDKLKTEAEERLKKRYEKYFEEQGQDWIPVDKLLRRYSNTGHKLNDEDILFFICLFLTRKDAHAFLSNIRGFKNTENEYRYSREYFTSFYVTLGKDKVVSTDPKQALQLRILSDLNKAPKYLYHKLTPAAQKVLRIKDELNINDDGETEIREITLRRYSDDFSYLALSYLEEHNAYAKWSFQLNLGKMYIRDPYPKKIGSDRLTRELDQDILCFGRLRSIDKDEIYKDLHTPGGKHLPPTYKIPLKQLRPKYHFSNGRIGIRTSTPSSLPDLTVKQRQPEQTANFIISEHELPYLVYFSTRNRETEVITCIHSFISKRAKFLKAFADGEITEVSKDTCYDQYGLQLSWIPQIIKDQLGHGHNRFLLTLKDKLEGIRKETKELLDYYDTENQTERLKIWVKDKEKDLRRTDNPVAQAQLKKNIEQLKQHLKYLNWMHQSVADDRDKERRQKELTEEQLAKRKPRLMKKGELAQWLARDMMHLTPPQPRTRISQVTGQKVHVVEKLSSAEYDVLQNRMAYFGKQEDGYFVDLFKTLGLVIDEDGVEDDKLQDHRLQGFAHPFLADVDLRFERKNRQGRVTGRGTVGLKGFFNRYLRHRSRWISQVLKNHKEGATSDDYHFIAIPEKRTLEEAKAYALRIVKEPIYLPRGLFKSLLPEGENLVYATRKEHNDAKQWFYNEDARLPDLLNIRDIDKKVRFEQLKDRLMWDMAINLSQSDSLKDKLESQDLNFYMKPDDKGSNNILDLEVEVKFKLHKKEVSTHMKIKDFGKTRAFLSDSRLEGIISYYDTDNLDLEALRQELLSYPIIQKKVLPLSYKIEILVKQKFPEQFETLMSKAGYVDFKSMLPLVANNDIERDIIRLVRNKLLHNQFPKDMPDVLDHKTKPKNITERMGHNFIAFLEGAIWRLEQTN